MKHGFVRSKGKYTYQVILTIDHTSLCITWGETLMPRELAFPRGDDHTHQDEKCVPLPHSVGVRTHCGVAVVGITLAGLYLRCGGARTYPGSC